MRCSPTPTPRASHDAALTDLENGVTSLWIQVGESGVDAGDLATVLDGVLLDVAPVVLDAPSDPLGVAHAFAALAKKGGGHQPCCWDQPRGRSGRHCRASWWFRDARWRSLLNHRDSRGGCPTRPGARLPGTGRRRDRGARPRGLRRPGARLRAGARRALPARARGRGGRGGRRRGPGGVPAGRERRAVRDDRQAPRRTPPLGADARAQRRRVRTTARWCSTPSRRGR